jgi:L-threonylcarbamoyladenylate synthase
VVRAPAWLDPRVFAALEDGGIIAYPSDTVWGLGCDPFRPDAIRRLVAAKRRSAAQGFVVIACDSDDLADWLSIEWREWLRKQQPERPTTYVLPCLKTTPDELTGGRKTLAARLVRNGIAGQLCRRFGPLVSTSANMHGKPVLTRPWQLRLVFGSELDWLVPGQPGGEKPSRLIDAVSGRVLRN